MNKKFIIFVGIILLLTAGISFAALLDYYGKITGNIEIKGPTFYPTNEKYDQFPIFPIYNLSINKIPEKTEMILDNKLSLEHLRFALFVTKKDYFKSGDFYPANYSVSLKAKSEKGTNLKVILGFLDNSLSMSELKGRIKEEELKFEIPSIPHQICNGEWDIKEDKVYNLKCESEEIQNLKGFWILYYIPLKEKVDEKEITIYLGEDTKIEVSKNEK